MATAIKNFTTKGGSVSGYRSITGGVREGVRDPDTGILWKHPRGKIDNGLASGGAVKIVNPRAMSGRVARRGRTIGMGLVGDQTT